MARIHIYGARVLCYERCVLFTRIEIRALDLIHLNIYGRDAICGQIHQTKAIDDREADERANGHNQSLTKRNECVNETILFHRNDIIILE